MEWLVLFVIFGAVGSAVASIRGGHLGAGFALGLFLGPLGILLAFLMGGRACPACRSRIHAQATKCPRCQEPLPPSEPAPSLEVSCRECSEVFPEAADLVRHIRQAHARPRRRRSF